MFLGSMRGNIRLDGFYENNLFFGPAFLQHRHAELEEHLQQHTTPIDDAAIALATDPWDQPPAMKSRIRYQDVKISKEMIKKSRMDLVSRCGVCRNLHLEAKRAGKKYRYRVPTQFSSTGSDSSS